MPPLSEINRSVSLCVWLLWNISWKVGLQFDGWEVFSITMRHHWHLTNATYHWCASENGHKTYEVPKSLFKTWEQQDMTNAFQPYNTRSRPNWHTGFLMQRVYSTRHFNTPFWSFWTMATVQLDYWHSGWMFVNIYKISRGIIWIAESLLSYYLYNNDEVMKLFPISWSYHKCNILLVSV